MISTAMGGFDTIAIFDKAFGTGDIAALNAKLHESKAYNKGDVVISFDPQTMEITYKTVLDVFSKSSNSLHLIKRNLQAQKRNAFLELHQ